MATCWTYFPCFEQVQRGKKMVEVPRRTTVPAQVKRAVTLRPISYGINSVYVLGLSNKDTAYSHKRFDAFRAYNIELLKRAEADRLVPCSISWPNNDWRQDSSIRR
jgi:hypothetical protein